MRFQMASTVRSAVYTVAAQNGTLIDAEIGLATATWSAQPMSLRVNHVIFAIPACPIRLETGHEIRVLILQRCAITSGLMQRSKQHSHSMTSGSRAGSVSGTVRPSILAV